MAVSVEIEYIILIIIGLLSEILGTMAGFGSSTIFLPLTSYFVEFDGIGLGSHISLVWKH
jgi:uncharacterized membrane protein YfcA